MSESNSNAGVDRREILGQAGVLAAAFSFAPRGAAANILSPARRPHGPLDFKAVERSTADAIVLAKGHTYQIFAPWGTRVDGRDAPFDLDASSEDQRRQTGMNHDGMTFFPIDATWDEAESRLVGRSDLGYLAINHEYTDEGKLHRDGTAGWAGKKGAEKVRKSKAAHGISILKIQEVDGQWKILGGRRVTGLDEVEISGPARGHVLMRTTGTASTAAEKAGTGADGTFGNCSNGQTPWGTYLTCEENFQDYFSSTPGNAGDLEGPMRRYGIGVEPASIEGARSMYGWEVHDPRFDSDRAEYRNTCHRYGWVVEVDPRDPRRKAVKRTALGRFRHENAAVVVAPDGRVVVYMADDGRFEYIYKFVSDRKFLPESPEDSAAERARKREHNWQILDHGKLFVARFDDRKAAPAKDSAQAGAKRGRSPEDNDRAGDWIELDHHRKELKSEFSSAAEVLIFARRAGDLVRATPMDRPEWVTIDQDVISKAVRNVYVSVTNNNLRGKPGLEGPNPANPRVNNVYGSIVRWQDANGDPRSRTFTWKIFVTCGYRYHPVAAQRGDIVDAKGETEQDYGAPDGLWLDPRGALWVESDSSVSVQDDADFKPFGNNQLAVVDKVTGETKRFMVGPRGCELTGFAITPDCKTMFINVQHPGQTPAGFSDPNRPLEGGAWPFGIRDNRTRSATLIVTHKRGLPIGAADEEP